MFQIRPIALLILALLGLGQAHGARPGIERKVLAMGTTLGLELSGPNEAQLQKASAKAIAEVARIEAGISTWREDSAFSRLNQAHGAPVSMEPEWLRLLAAVRNQALRTGGAFDPTLMPLLRSWGVREGGSVPTEAALGQAREASGIRFLKLVSRRGTAQLSHVDAGIEEGGFGKGYALDRASRSLRRSGVPSGLLDFGGQLLAFGAARTVSLANPKDRFQPRLMVVLKKASLSSSGTSEKGAHILDPATGNPCPPWGSVGVIAATGLEADCLSTALFVMGPEKGLRWASGHKVAACFLKADGEIRMSPAFRSLNPHLL